jgi:uncharacterized membrane protein
MIAELAISIIWILAFALLFRLLSVWDQLPERVAVHFGVSLQPNGWGRRSTLALLMALIVVGHAVLSTWLVFAHAHGSGIVAAAQLAVASVLFSVFWQTITFNISRKPLKAIWMVLPVLLIAVSIAALLSGTLFLRSVR